MNIEEIEIAIRQKLQEHKDVREFIKRKVVGTSQI